ncbi:MAG: hypothetical protein AMXMBFR33_65710 [Candidatus Xenobia bacterium]
MIEKNPLVRAGLKLADFAERWFPDAFVFALLGVVITFLGGLAVGEAPLKLVQVFGDAFSKKLAVFTLQMMLVIVGGYVVASSPPVYALIKKLATVPRSSRQAVAFVALLSMVSSLFSWGLSLIFTGLLVREICTRLPRVDYRAIGAAAYLGLGSVWAFGLSSSAALMQATRSSLPDKLHAVTGVIPLSQTIFLWQSMLCAVLLISVSVAIAYFSCPSDEQAKTQEDFGIRYQPLTVEVEPPQRPGEWWEHTPILPWAVGLLMLVYVLFKLSGPGGPGEKLDLDLFNFSFITLGLLLHGQAKSFLKAVSASIPATAGVIIQFPFYAGIFGLISETHLSVVLEDIFRSISSPATFPLLVAVYSAVLGVFVPSGGGKWVIEAPYVMGLANEYQINLGWTVQIYNAAEALPNLLNPFWMLPLMGILSVRARELAGYSVLQLLFHVPLVLLLCWVLTGTLPYTPPVP